MMKKVIYASFVLLALAFAQSSKAQVNLNINIGHQPQWGPLGYDYARYYYMPELDVYYDVSNRNYTYYDGRRWTSHRSLPKRYHGFDLYRTYKVVINDARPWRNHKIHHQKYRRYAKNYKQANRRNHREREKYHKAIHKQNKKMEKARAKHAKKMHKHRGKEKW